MPPTTLILATGNPHKVDELRAIFAAITPRAGSSSPAAAIKVLGLKDLPPHHHDRLHEPAEPGATCEENARIKALSYAQQIGDPHAVYLADDSGIEIDALMLPNGTPRPGVISSHYATDGVETGLTREQRDAANNARVLREMEGVPMEQRTARFVCCMCLARVSGFGSRVSGAEETPAASSAFTRNPNPDTRNPIPPILFETRGTMEGRIGIPPRIPAGSNGFGYDPLFLVAAAPFNYTKTGAELSSAEKNALSHRGMAARAMVEWVSNHPQVAAIPKI